MRTRGHDWYDSKRECTAHGIQLRIGQFWSDLFINGSLFIAESDEQRRLVRKQLSKLKENELLVWSNCGTTSAGSGLNVRGDWLTENGVEWCDNQL